MGARVVQVQRPVETVKLSFAASDIDFSSIGTAADPKPLLVVSRLREGSLDDAVVVAQSVSIQVGWCSFFFFVCVCVCVRVCV